MQQVLNAVFHSTLIPLMYRETERSTAVVAKFIVCLNGLCCKFLEENENVYQNKVGIKAFGSGF